MKVMYFLATIMCLLGCSRPKPIYHYVSNDIKNDFNFKPGTYWIMRDSISGRVDSFFVTNNWDALEEITNGGRENAAAYYERIYVVIADRNTDPAHASDSQYWAYTYIYSSVSFGSDFRPYSPYPYWVGPSYMLFDYPKPDSFLLDTKFHPDMDTGIVTQRLNTCEINGLSFTSVAITNHYCSGSARDTAGLYFWGYNDLLYVAPKIGIIKMRLNHRSRDTTEHVWEIQRYNIKM